MQHGNIETPLIGRYDPNGRIEKLITASRPRISNNIYQGEWVIKSIWICALLLPAIFFLNDPVLNFAESSTDTVIGPVALYYAAGGYFSLYVLPLIAASLLRRFIDQRRKARVTKWLGTSAKYEKQPQSIARYRLLSYIAVWSGFFLQVMFPVPGSVNLCGHGGTEVMSNDIVGRLSCASDILIRVASFFVIQ